VTVLSASVGEELHGRVGAAALVGDGRLGLLRVNTTDSGNIGRVVGVAKRNCQLVDRGGGCRVMFMEMRTQ